jgi:hypothetical protein
MQWVDRWPRPILHVVRLKPGETHPVELALPSGGFPREAFSGRQYSRVRMMRKTEAEDDPDLPYSDEEGGWKLRDGLHLVWEGDKPGVSFRAARDVKPGTVDLCLYFFIFAAGSGEHFIGFQVVVETG